MTNRPDHDKIFYTKKAYRGTHAGKREMERKMAGENIKRFGVIAVEKGFITLEKLLEAMTIQIQEGMEGKKHRLIGQIMLSLGYLTSSQIDEVMESLDAQ